MPKWSEANCMGYALDRNEWLILEAWEKFSSINDYDEPYEDEIRHTRQDMIAEAIEEMQHDYGLMPVARHEMRLGREYIALKMTLDDFHFMKRNKKGYWRHKPGGTRVQSISEDKVFASKWKGGSSLYNTPTLLFEVIV